jgi:hypothetical protein
MMIKIIIKKVPEAAATDTKDASTGSAGEFL